MNTLPDKWIIYITETEKRLWTTSARRRFRYLSSGGQIFGRISRKCWPIFYASKPSASQMNRTVSGRRMWPLFNFKQRLFCNNEYNFVKYFLNGSSVFQQTLFFCKNFWNRLKKWPLPLGIGEGTNFFKGFFHVWSYFPRFFCIKGEGIIFDRIHIFMNKWGKIFSLGLQNTHSHSK